ncbi:MAG: thermonuclease family protein, partial [Hyphomonadaceae bacterium]
TKGLEKGETGKVVSVIDGDTLTLESGAKVQLTGILAPRRAFRDRPAEPLADESRLALEKMALGRTVLLAYGGEKKLGEDLMLAQVFVQTEGGRWIWAQQAMLREGMARARTWKTNHARAGDLFAAEAQARKAKIGLWKEKAYAVRAAGTVAAGERGYQTVEGVVRAVDSSENGRTYLNFGDDYRTDFTVRVNGKDLDAWTPEDPALTALKGKRVRVRGFVHDSGGPMIDIDHPQAIEIVS